MHNSVFDIDLSNDAFTEVKRLIIERTGNFYYADKDAILRDRIARRMRARHLHHIDQYAVMLRGPGDIHGEWLALEAEITIGETFFFRFADQFAALRNRILPAILEANAEVRRVRIWSAGCANGAEAYSVAILLDELLGPALPDWRVTVLGSDINARSIANAQAAVYGAWTLRGMPPQDRERYFVPTTNREWELRPRYRSLVRFQRHNLISLLNVPPPVQFTDFDLILCRNVLIYFHPDTARRMAHALGQCLADRRWIFFGHAETGSVDVPSLTPVALPGTTIYCRDCEGGDLRDPVAITTSAVREPMPASNPPQWQPLLPSPVDANLPTPVVMAPSVVATSPGVLRASPASVELMRALADKGDIAAALALCTDLLTESPLCARLHFHEGILHLAAGAHIKAVDALRRAVYLKKDFALAHFHLGLALLEMDEVKAGRRAVSAAMQCTAQVLHDTLVEDGDGMTAGDLRAMARHYLKSSTLRFR